jgi:drug/metabolite transporter (DMT)-like permease
MKKWLTSTGVLVVALVLMWGFSWAFIKIGLRYSPALIFAGLRTFIGGLTLVIVAAVSGSRPAFRQHWHVYVLSAAFNVFLFFGLQTVGMEYLPSGLLAVLVYFQPILSGVFAWLFLSETFSVRKIIGLAFGFLGVAAVSIGGIEGHTSMLGIFLAICGGLAWAIGTVYSKHVQGRVNMTWLIALQFVIGGIGLLIGAVFTESFAALQLTPTFLVSFAYSALIGVSLSWIVWFTLVHRGEVTKVTSYVFFVPILSVIIGIVFLHERFTLYLLVGLLFVTLGIYLVNSKSKRERKRAEEAMQTNSSFTA